MNCEGHLLAFCALGETGNSLVVIKQEGLVEGLKLFPGGNKNVIISKKNFKKLLKQEILQVVDKIPEDIFLEFKTAWERNNDEKTVV